MIVIGEIIAFVCLLPNIHRFGGTWCYEANGEPVDQTVTLEDQFSGPDTVRVEQPVLFCNPVVKVHDGKRFRIQER